MAEEPIEDVVKKSFHLFSHHCNPLFAAYRILNKYRTVDAKTLDELESCRQDFIRRMRAAAVEVTEETKGITKTHFYEVANVAANHRWDSPKQVNTVYGMVRKLGIRNVDDHCKTCLNGKATSSKLFLRLFKPVSDAMKFHAEGETADRQDPRIGKLKVRFAHCLATVLQEHENYEGIISKEAITHLHELGNGSDWNKPEAVGTLYEHGCKVFGKVPHNYNTRKK